MIDEIPDDWRSIVVATYSDVKELKRRADEHSKRDVDNFNKLNEKLDNIREVQHKDKEFLLAEINKIDKKEIQLNGKVATLVGGASIAGSAAMHWVIGLFKHQ